MDPLTLFLAKLIGPAVLAVGLGIFFSRNYYTKVYRNLGNESMAVLMSGLIILIAGIVMVLYHNTWDNFLSGFISLIGWLAILKGLTFIIFPKTADKMGDMIAGSKWFSLAVILYTIAGAYISYVAYLA